ncbi:MAG TPA: FtsX-like permease family protein [Armatimonadetes bacterium]|nr:FtsX-like permease family protein [Armatimonadota bacterium]
MGGKRLGKLLGGVIGGMLLLMGLPAWAQEEIDAATVARYQEWAAAVDEKAIERHVYHLASLGSRVTGYPGCEMAATYVFENLAALGFEDVHYEEYEVAVPIDRGASIEVLGEEGRELEMYPLWPNLVRTPQLPPQGREGKLIYARGSALRDYNGEDVDGSIVLVDFNCGLEWLNAPRLGAKAVIFIEPDSTVRGEAEAKFISIPIDFPRYYISRRNADYLLTLLETRPEVRVRLRCRMTWERRRARNIVAFLPGRDSNLASQIVCLQAYYDSMCVVPSLAPGAESALGVATLLELARVIKANPPGRSVMFLATSGHFEGLAGTRAFLENHFTELEEGSLKLSLFIALDLSSRTEGVGLFFKGMLYNQREDIRRNFSDLARICRENAQKIAVVLGVPPDRAFADGVNPVQGKDWRNFIPGRIALSHEPFTLGGGRGIALVTIDDSRPLVDTPFDLPESVNFSNVFKQARMISCLLADILNDPAISLPGRANFRRMSVTGGFAQVAGRVAVFDPKESFIPDKPVPNSLVVLKSDAKTYMGVRGHFIEMADEEEAWFQFNGMAPTSAGRGKTSLEAYALDPLTGAIVYAPDRGVSGAEVYPIDISVNLGRKELTIVVFPCVATALFELIDPQTMNALATIDIYDGVTDSQPRVYGYAMSKVEDRWQSHVETTAVIFSIPGSRFKVVMGAGPAAKRLVLINSYYVPPGGQIPVGAEDRRDAAEGLGYLVLSRGAVVPRDKIWAEKDRIAPMIYYTPMMVATDMWNLDEFRIKNLARFRIINQVLNQLHESAREELEKAAEALKEKKYDKFSAHARAAWGYEARAYPDVQKTADDVVKGVIFYLALLVPFAYFAERLLFAKPDIRQQILYTFGIFFLIFLIFSQVHPAFDITINPVIILLAFVMMALSVLVIAIVVMKFEEQLKQLQRRISGRHTADIGRLGVAAAAFNLGISNMRRRKARTALTCATLILLTFTVLSFTSVVTNIRFNVVPSPGTPLYNGIMVRSAIWRPLQEQAYRVLWDEFGETRAVTARAWFYTSELGEQSFVNVTCTKSNKDYDAKAIVGMTPAEARVTGIDKCLRAGRWFRPGERYVCIIPEGIADAFNLTPEDIGKVKLQFNGVEFNLIGIFDNNKLKQLEDLDEEMLTPVDFIMMQKLQSQAGGGAAARSEEAEAGFREYLHLAPDSTLFIPFETLINFGGDLRSVAIDFVTPEEVKRVLRKLMPRLGFNLYAGQGDRIYKYSSMSSTTILGAADLVIPILIAALIVLNTMLGAVYERIKEIHIFSSIGLAPIHVAVLFIAESFVYAILGAIVGYLLGQVAAKVLTIALDHGYLQSLAGLSLNYSSTAAIISTSIVITVVLLSTLYPAKKASQVATPGVERRWQVPEPEGDVWTIRLPFSVTGKQAIALNQFMAEWFTAYEEYSIGDFVTENTQLEEFDSEYGKGYRITLMAWLAPFDLGVSQRVNLQTTPTSMEDVYDIDLILHRESGDVSSWKRVNRRFLNTIRKQFLIWRTLGIEERELYKLSEEERIARRQQLEMGLVGVTGGTSSS